MACLQAAFAPPNSISPTHAGRSGRGFDAIKTGRGQGWEHRGVGAAFKSALATILGWDSDRVTVG